MQSESIKVLIVQGSQHTDVQVEAILASAGFATRVAGESVSALGALEIWRPSVALVDLRFPSSEAHRFCASLADRPETSSLPLVLVGEGPNLLKRTTAVPDGLVATPIDPDHLVATVRKVVREVYGTRIAPLSTR